MKIEFDPRDQEQCDAVVKVMDALHSGTNVTVNVNQTITESPSPEPVSNISSGNEHRIDPADDDAVDVHGMKWNPDYHASTKGQNADGSWKAARGKKDEADAALKAHLAQSKTVPTESTITQQSMPGVTEPTPAPEPEVSSGGMPGAEMPSPVETVQKEPEPVDYNTVSTKFINMMQAGAFTDHQALYDKVGITSPKEMETNETLRANMYALLNAIETDGLQAALAS